MPDKVSLKWLNGLLWTKLTTEPTQDRGEQQQNIDTGFQHKPFQLRAWRGIIKHVLDTTERPVNLLCCDMLYPSGDGAGTHVRRCHGITITKNNRKCIVGFDFKKNPRFVSVRDQSDRP